MVDVLGDVEAELPELGDVGFDLRVVGRGAVVRREDEDVGVRGGEVFAPAVAADGVEADGGVGDGLSVEGGEDVVDLCGVVGDEAVHVVVAAFDVRGEGGAQAAQVVARAAGFGVRRGGWFCRLPVGGQGQGLSGGSHCCRRRKAALMAGWVSQWASSGGSPLMLRSAWAMYWSAQAAASARWSLAGS